MWVEIKEVRITTNRRYTRMTSKTLFAPYRAETQHWHQHQTYYNYHSFHSFIRAILIQKQTIKWVGNTALTGLKNISKYMPKREQCMSSMFCVQTLWVKSLFGVSHFVFMACRPISETKIDAAARQHTRADAPREFELQFQRLDSALVQRKQFWISIVIFEAHENPSKVSLPSVGSFDKCLI